MTLMVDYRLQIGHLIFDILVVLQIFLVNIE